MVTANVFERYALGSYFTDGQWVRGTSSVFFFRRFLRLARALSKTGGDDNHTLPAIGREIGFKERFQQCPQAALRGIRLSAGISYDGAARRRTPDEPRDHNLQHHRCYPLRAKNRRAFRQRKPGARPPAVSFPLSRPRGRHLRDHLPLYPLSDKRSACGACS
jgi:hypothetical protein